MSQSVINPYTVVGASDTDSFKRDFTIDFQFRSFYKNGNQFHPF
jgi:hypothetical protein